MLLIFRTCIPGKQEYMSNSLKEFLKEQLDVKNDTQLETHLEPLYNYKCEKGRHWSSARVVNSTEGLDPDFMLKKDNLQNLITNEIVKENEFCITENEYKQYNILAHACK